MDEINKIKLINNHILSQLSSKLDKDSDVRSFLENVLEYPADSVQKIISGEHEICVHDIQLMRRHCNICPNFLFEGIEKKLKNNKLGISNSKKL